MNNSKVIPILIELVQNTSKSRLIELSKTSEIELDLTPNNTIVRGYWMSMILLSGKSLRILFKVHFMSPTGIALSQQVANQNASIEQGLGFFKEYCNLTAGRLKVLLAQNNLDVSISLPAIAMGFDEVFYKDRSSTFTSNWNLKYQKQTIACSVHIDIFDEFDLTHKNTQDETGEVEFL